MAEHPYDIDEQARHWVAREDRESLSASEQASLSSWLDADTRHRGAYLRAQAIWRLLDRPGDAIAAEPEARPASAPSRRWVLAGASGLAASIIGGVGIEQLAALRRGRLSTEIGDIRRVALDDGSLAVINTSSTIDVALRKSERVVTLSDGEAWFDVAKDAARPFVVRVGGITVRALGTAFSVRRRGDGTDIQVTEGVVATWAGADPRNMVRIAAGSRAFVDEKIGPAIPEEAPLAIDRSLAWRSGEIVLDGETLGEAAAEFNRYNRRKVLVDDPELAAAELVGRFHTNEPDAFIRAAVATLGTRWPQAAAAIRLTDATS